MLQYFAIASLLCLLVHGYFALRLRPAVANLRRWRWLRRLAWANVLLLPGSLVAALRAPAQLAFVAVPLGHLAFADVGFCLLLAVGLLGRDLVLGLAWGLLWLGSARSGRGALSPPRRRLLLGGLDLATFGLAGGATALGYGVALCQPQLRRLRVPLSAERLPVGWGGLRLVQLSDLHVGPTIRRGYVEKLVATVNALSPDLVVITGDLVDGFVEQLRDEVAPLGSLAARHGVFFVTGNHEYFYRAEEWLAELSRLGLTVLSNRQVALQHDGATLQLCGLADPSAGGERSRAALLQAALAGQAATGPRLLLTHRPSDVAVAAAAGVDLQLSGHLHGGQFFPLTVALLASEPYVAGLYRVGATWLYVNRGAGYWGPPNRLGMRQELTLIELVRGAA